MMVRSRRVALATMITAVALAAALLQTIAQASSADSSTRINAGGPAVQDAGGATWLGDRNFKGGTALTSTTQVSGTTAPEVYDNARVGMTAYQIPVAAAGTYRVRLLFAELQHAQAGQRVFTVRAEGRKFVSDLDLAAVAGYAAAYDVVRDVSVTDGTLNVKFVNTVGVATVSAIEVVPLTPATTTTTAAATSSTTTTTAAPTTTTAAPTTTTTTAPTTTTAAPTTTTTTAPTTTTSAPTTTSTTTTTAPPPVSGAKLSWAPPALTNPITLTVGTGGGTFN
nr:malectin [Acidimicrobiales bacterium]